MGDSRVLRMCGKVRAKKTWQASVSPDAAADDGDSVTYRVMNDLPIIPIAYTGEVRATTKGLSIERSHTGNGLLYWQDFAWA